MASPEKLASNKKQEKEDSQLYVWQGYTGNVELVSYTTFLQRPVNRVALGADHSLILTYGDEVYAVGSNHQGQLGCPESAGEYLFDPCLVKALSGQGVTEIACGKAHSSAIRNDGSIYLWGDNQHAQCARNPTQYLTVASPELVELSFPGYTCGHGVASPRGKEKALRISCGAQHNLVLSDRNNVWLWGNGPQLGLGDIEVTWVPERLTDFCDRKVLSVACGDFHNLILVQEEADKAKRVKQDRKSPVKEKAGSECRKCVLERKKSLAREKRKSGKQENDGEFASKESATDVTSQRDSAKDRNNEPPSDMDKKETVVEVHISPEGSKKTEISGLSLNDKDLNKETVTEQRNEEKEEQGIKDVQEPTADLDSCANTSHTFEQIETNELISETTCTVDSNTENSVTNNDNVDKTLKTKEEHLHAKAESEKGIEDISNNDMFTSSIRSNSSLASTFSSKVSKSKSFLDETGALEFLKKQFEADEIEPQKLPKREFEKALVTISTAPSSPGSYMLHTVSSLTSQVGTMTTKALSSIASVPGKLKLTYSTSEADTKSSENVSEIDSNKSKATDADGTDAGENFNAELGSLENLDNSVFDLSDVSASDPSLNASRLSLPESEASVASGESGGSLEESSLMRSPANKRDDQSRLSVSRESQSIRTIEAMQENLRKRSLSLLPTEEEGKTKKELSSGITVSIDTEIWCWGRNSKGQLGLGDMLERNKPVCLQIMTGRRIVKVTCGMLHSVAISSTGEVYSWGLNDSGQLGHKECFTCSPARVELDSRCVVWDAAAGSNHSIILVDEAPMQETKPDVFYAGKHPCKDLYVPIFKTAKLTNLPILKRKIGWINTVTTGGDNCACIARSESSSTQVVFRLTRYLRDFHCKLHAIGQNFVKRFLMSGFFTSLDVKPYKKMFARCMRLYMEVMKQFGEASVEMTELLCRGENCLSAILFTRYEDYLVKLKDYLVVFEDMIATSGFEYAVKSSGSLFDNLKEFYEEMLPGYKLEEKPDHASKFREIMNIPLRKVKGLSDIINLYADTFDKSSREHNTLSGVHLNLEHFVRTSNIAVTEADNTKKFWDLAGSKIAEALRKPARRLIKESKASPLTLINAGRFSTHSFYLFNDIFIHSQNSTPQSYALETVWIEVPSTENSTYQNLITITTPEEILTVSASTPQVKTEWLVAFNTTINKVLSAQKTVNRQLSGERVHTPVVRLASHTFTKHPLFKDGYYYGYWLNGKIHGSGQIKWKDGRRYKGKFQNGTICGSGCMTIPKDNKQVEVQEGTWKDAKLHGQGTIRYSTGDLYEGYFKDGLRHGHGVYRKGRHHSNASYIYVGEWLYDKKHGYGVMDDTLHGEKYMGMWQDGSRHGDGVVVTLDGMYFEGNFQYNKLVGHGLMLTDDNSSYEGEFAGITLLQGKGCLTFPNGDKIEGLFNGTWNEGLKMNGTFKKLSVPLPTTKYSWNKKSHENLSSLYGKLSVRPDRKWEEIFYQCYERLGHTGEGEPNCTRAWDQVVKAIVAGKLLLRDRERGPLSAKQRLELSTLEQLEKVPTHGVERLSIEQYKGITHYLSMAFKTPAHPLGKLVDDLVDVFRAAYVGIGAHPRLLLHAKLEILSYIRRIYKVLRVLFPELPSNEKPSYLYSETANRNSVPLDEEGGFLQRQISETEAEELPTEVVSMQGILQPILIPRIYPAVFDLYALHCDREDQKYWERVQKLNKQGDMALMAYLGIDQSYWCFDEEMFKLENMKISCIKDQSYVKAVEGLQQISTAFCPLDKLEVIQKTFLEITQMVQEYIHADHTWCMDDLFPVFQYVVLRARIHHLGAEISFIEDLMEGHLEYGELGIMFTTLKACYFQIQNEKVPTH